MRNHGHLKLKMCNFFEELTCMKFGGKIFNLA